MDQLAAMRAFIRIVETGSYTQAATSLNVPKPTLTKHIQQLEAHLRTSLLSRTTRRIAVTADGAAYYERAVRLLAELDELDGSLAMAQVHPRGRLRIDVLAVLARQVIIPALDGFLELYPDIQIEIGASDRPTNLIAESVDCVIRGGVISDPSLIARRIANLAMLTCAAPGYLARRGEPAHPSELHEGRHQVVSYFNAGTGRFYGQEFTRDGQTVEIEGNYRVAVNEIGSYMAAVAAGHGIAQLPVFTAQPMLESGQLRRVLADWAAPSIPLYVVYPPHRHLSNKVRVFVDWVVGLFAAPHVAAGPPG
ncbi:MAG TPA: LysR substrate-binding domain-containing protein [Rhodopila sp.]|uniref:LysR family transcriptional regulator n=1 Tax=Rhodopila sp. TaxID=2480087 RepID=UPI002CF8D4F5|nr:LysR substrate-binding domain-containing protein [Rhodopila sp.]HVY14653.1 LysR substrate-binding domain-containing protein [Rhodopila sp.]